jgi:hypothetical protein
VNGYFNDVEVPRVKDLRNYRELTPHCPWTSLTLSSVSANPLALFLSQTDHIIHEFPRRLDTHDKVAICSCGYLYTKLQMHFLWILNLMKDSSRNTNCWIVCSLLCVTNWGLKIEIRASRTFASYGLMTARMTRANIEKLHSDRRQNILYSMFTAILYSLPYICEGKAFSRYHYIV